MGNMSREDAETHLARNADQMVFLVRESKGRLCLTIRQKNNLGCAHSFIERGRNLYWTMRNGVKISAPTLFQLMVQLGLPLPAQQLQDVSGEMYQSVPDAGVIGAGSSNNMGGSGIPPPSSMGMPPMGSGFAPSSQMPGFMPNSLGRPPMPNSSPMLPGMNGSQPPPMMGNQMSMGSQPRFAGGPPLPQQVNQGQGGGNGGANKNTYAPAGLAARGVVSPYDDQGQNWSNNGGNNNNNNNGMMMQQSMQQQQMMMGNDQMMMQGGGGGGNGGGNSMRDNVHLIDEQDIQLMKVNGMPERIGEGAYGIVYRGEWTFDKESTELVDPWLERRSNRVVTVAVKQLGGSSPDKEIAVWTTLRHPNIVPLFGLVDSLKEKLVMPYCNGVSLRRRLTDLPQECSERKFQLRVLRDVAAGVAYLHEKNIVHRDLAARNVLLHRFRGTNPDQEVALLADFGLTRKIDAKAQYNAANFNVPLQPLAPEQLLDYHNGRAGCRSTPQSDVWAFGVLCGELLLPNVDQFYAEVTQNCGSNTGAWIECVYQYVTVDCRTPLDDFNLNEATVDVVAVAKRCMQHNDTTRPMMKDIYRQLREQCDMPEPKTVGDVPKALYGSSELDIVVREAIEGERQFARRLDVLFNVFEKELQACTMSDNPVMTIADIKTVFRNSGTLYNAANSLQAALATCERANFGAVMLETLKKTKFEKVLGEYLKGVLSGQALLYELMYPKQRQMKKRAESLQLFLDQQSANRKAKGLNLPDLLSSPYAHLTEMKRMLARIMTHTDSKTDKAALEEATKLLNAIPLDGEREVTEGQAKEIVGGLNWRKLPGDQYPLDANAKRNLLRMGELGVVMAGTRKPKSRTVYLFDDAIVVCDKKNALALLELVESAVDCNSLGPSAFQVTARAIRDARLNVIEFVCEARRDALHWVDDIEYVVKNKKARGGASEEPKREKRSEPREEEPKREEKREEKRDDGMDRSRSQRDDRSPGMMERERSGRMDMSSRGGGGMDDRNRSMSGMDRGMGGSGMGGSGMGGMGGSNMDYNNYDQQQSNNMYGQSNWDSNQGQGQDWGRSGRRDAAYDQTRIMGGQQSGWDESQQNNNGNNMPGYTRGQPGAGFANSGFAPPPSSNDMMNSSGRNYNGGGGSYDDRQNMNSSRPGGGNFMGGSRPPPFPGSQVPMGSMGMQPGSMQIQPPPMGSMGMRDDRPPMGSMGMRDDRPPMGSMGMRDAPAPQMNSMGLPPMQTANTLQMNSMGLPPNRGGPGGSMAGPPGAMGRTRSRTDANNNSPQQNRLDMMMSAPMGRQRSPSPQRRMMPNSMGMMPSRQPSMAGGNNGGWDNEDNMTEYEDYDDDQNNYVALPDARGGNGNMMGGSMPMGQRDQGQEAYVALPVDQPRGGVVNAIQSAVQQSRQRGGTSSQGNWN